MPYNVLLLPLLGGFVFVTFWDRTRWHAHRADKERLLIYAGLAGLVFLAVAFVLRSIPPFIPCSSLFCPPTWWDRHIGFPQSGVATFAFALGALGWWPANRFADWWYRKEGGSKRREFVKVVETNGGPLEQLLLRSMQDEKAVMLTLKGGKVYIGGIGAGFVPGQDTTIHLLPSKSGFRDGMQRLNLTTHYDEAYAKIKEHETDSTGVIGSFGIIIPVDEVVAASLYLPDVHAKYFPHVSRDNEPLEMD